MPMKMNWANMVIPRKMCNDYILVTWQSLYFYIKNSSILFLNNNNLFMFRFGYVLKLMNKYKVNF
jgi:hypothetical protein